MTTEGVHQLPQDTQLSIRQNVWFMPILHMMYNSYCTLTTQIKGQQETGKFCGLCDHLISLIPTSGGHIKGPVVYSEIQHVPEAVLFHSNGCGSNMVSVKFFTQNSRHHRAQLCIRVS